VEEGFLLDRVDRHPRRVPPRNHEGTLAPIPNATDPSSIFRELASMSARVALDLPGLESPTEAALSRRVLVDGGFAAHRYLLTILRETGTVRNLFLYT
jgi:hypothetical protein